MDIVTLAHNQSDATRGSFQFKQLKEMLDSGTAVGDD